MNISDEIWAVGHLTIDNLVSHQKKSCYFDVPQGNALSSALGARMWSANIQLVSRVGMDYPSDVLSTLNANGIGTNKVQSVGSKSLRFWILREHGDVAQDLPLGTPDWVQLTPCTSDLGEIAAPKAVHLAPMPLMLQLEFARHFKSKGSLVSVDCQPLDYVDNEPAANQIYEEILDLCDIYSPSIDDLRPTKSFSSANEAIASLPVNKQRKIITLKMGAGGSLLSANGSIQCIPIFSTESFESTGAGDAYAGAFLASFAQTQDVTLSALRASATASAIINQVGFLHVLEQKDEIARRAELLINQFT